MAGLENRRHGISLYNLLSHFLNGENDVGRGYDNSKDHQAFKDLKEAYRSFEETSFSVLFGERRNKMGSCSY